jgi:galactokinase
VELSGADILIHSEVPVGSGLSSSAALEVSTALALLSVNEHQMDLKKMALLCQKAENEFVGMKCGIMDQFIACFGQQDSALFLDCRSLEYQLIPLSHEEVSVVVCNTMVKHELGASEYNKRRAECEQGIQIMSQQLPGIKALRDVSLQQFNDLREMLPQIVRKRCLHVISENARTRQSAKALNDGDYARFGRLMHASHESLRDDYEVSCKELDIMVEKADAIAGVLGARMTGGGFGGCTVNLVKKGKEHDFSDEIAQQYEAATHLKPEVYICNPSQGAHEVA